MTTTIGRPAFRRNQQQQINNDGSEKVFRYRGDTKKCIRDGTSGVYRYELGGNGLFHYEGPWLNGQKHGSTGKFAVKGLLQVTGDFHNGEITGNAVKTFVSGARYEGEFHDGEMHGDGRWESADGNEVYEGSFRDNQRSGHGTITWRDTAAVFRGSFVRHKRHGQGTYFCKNELYLEAQFEQNVIEGSATVTWHRTAHLEGTFKHGLIDGHNVAYSAVDRSYRFVGPCRQGRPAVESEAAYVCAGLDRSAVAIKTVEAPVPSSKTAKAASKGKVEVASDRMVVLPGGELGKVMVRAGTQGPLDEERRRHDAAASAAEANKDEKKKDKGKDKAAVSVVSLEPCPYPEPGGTHMVPSEARRVVVLRILPVVPVPVPVPVEVDPASIDVSKDKGGEATVDGSKDEETFGEAVTFWLKKQSQTQSAVESGRWALTSVAYEDGQRVITPRSCMYPPIVSDAADGAVDALVGMGYAEKGSRSPKVTGSKGPKRASFAAPLTGDTQAAIVWPPVEFTVGPSVGELTRPSAAPESVSASTSAPAGEDEGKEVLTARSMGGMSAYVLSAACPGSDLSLQVPYRAVNGAEQGVTAFVDFALDESALVAAARRAQLGAGVETSTVAVPVLSLDRLLRGGAGADGDSAVAPPMMEGIAELLLVLVVTEASIASSESRRAAAAAAAYEVRRQAAVNSAWLEWEERQACVQAAAEETKRGGSKGSKSAKGAGKGKSAPGLASETANADPVPSAGEVFDPSAVVVPAAEPRTLMEYDVAALWDDCTWELRAVHTSPVVVEVEAMVAAMTHVSFQEGQEQGRGDEKGAGKAPAKGGKASKDKSKVKHAAAPADVALTPLRAVRRTEHCCRRWAQGTFNPTDWHSLALTLKPPATGAGSDLSVLSGLVVDGDSSRVLPVPVPIPAPVPSNHNGGNNDEIAEGPLGTDAMLTLTEYDTVAWLLPRSAGVDFAPATLPASAPPLPSNPEELEALICPAPFVDAASVGMVVRAGPHVPTSAGGQGRSHVENAAAAAARGSELTVALVGAVKAMALSGGGDAVEVAEVSSCFKAWRERQNEWTSCNSKPAPTLELQQAPEPREGGIAAHEQDVTPAPAAAIPDDCQALKDVAVALVCGYGEIDSGRIVLPPDIPPGKYVIEITDGVLPKCVRQCAPQSAESSANPTSVRDSSPPALEDVCGMARLVRSLQVNRQVAFFVDPPAAP